jgi:ABC-type polysaccharide/polyol phosphate transport system ATPase subunit/SAM-dependent methyltransferase
MSKLIELRDVSKRFLLRHNPSGELKVHFLGLFQRHYREIVDELWALKNISLKIGQGETIGLIGRNGSGKSTLLKLVAGIYRPTSGRLMMANGARIGTLIELGVGFHVQLTGQENVYLNAAIHGLTREDIDRLYPAVVEYSGLDEFMDVPLKNYSSGMQMRLGFAVAANLNPDILLLDEIFAVGDEDFQKQCHRTMRRFQSEGKTILFVSHASAAIRTICQRACLLDHGELLYDGEVDGGLAAYQRLMMETAESAVSAAGAAAGQGASSGQRSDGADLDFSWHRIAAGGPWDVLGDLQFDFLRAQGLRPSHYVLDVGCGALRAGVRLIPYLERGHYVGIDSSPELVKAGLEIELPRRGGDRRDAAFVINERFDLSDLPPFDFAIANGLFSVVPWNAAALCIASVVRKLAPGGRFYATYFESSDAALAEPVVHPSGVTTYPDLEPYHVSFEVLARLCDAVGATAERIGPWGHPADQMMACITRKT